MIQFAQFGGSLVAIILLAWLVHKLGLGGDMRIRNEQQARELADEAESGFEPVEIAIDRAGYSAIMRDAGGRILLLRRHGANFAGRLITLRPDARLDQGFLTIFADDKPFGPVTLNLGNAAQEWAASLRRLEKSSA
uniref:hypothetical protein n=1 Tax=Parerythrobacter lutipelagi TaxID=1964208 RepID=UPI0010F7A575|nr:hypothetical protein [Parerythrobacter lutipelagi]